ncbi:hypothetical protein FRC04_005609 [Tulasnella sp. 424]|nr:hypothetical protein FRC04_005609 [Tulasnella sp. 424]KAG8976156.1 hypothetical protein FRC05_004405 [Tulasnella sp. 425]
MSTIQRLRNVLVNILVFLFVFILPTSVLLPLSGVNGVGFMKLRDIWPTFQYSSLPYPPHLSSASIVLGSFKIPACIALLILTLSAFLYIRNVYGRQFTPDCYQSFNDCVAQVRLSILLQHNEVLANGLQKATADIQKATADIKQEQAMSKFHREMVEAACRKYVELQTASTEALRRSNTELDESKKNVVRLNTLVVHLRQDLEHAAEEHKRDTEAADQDRLKAIAIVRYAQTEASELRSEAASTRLELDAMRVEIDLVRRELGASKRRARVARNEAGVSDTENASLRSALAQSRKEVSTVRKGAETLMAELKAQKADNKKLDCLLAAYKQGVLVTSPPLTPPGSVTPPEGVKFTTFPNPETNFALSGREPSGTEPVSQQPNRVSNEGTVTSNARSLRRLLRPWGSVRTSTGA